MMWGTQTTAISLCLQKLFVPWQVVIIGLQSYTHFPESKPH